MTTPGERIEHMQAVRGLLARGARERLLTPITTPGEERVLYRPNPLYHRDD